jgi:hypothetical protein
MKIADWLYFPIVCYSLGMLTLLLSFGFWTAFSRLVNPDLYFFFLFLAPFLFSLPLAYAIFSRRFRSPSQRRLIAGILLAILGTMMFLSGIGTMFYGIGFSSSLDLYVALFIGVLGVHTIIAGFRLTLPQRSNQRAISHPSSIVAPSLPAEKGVSGYLPAAGTAALLATLLSCAILFFTLPTGLFSCSGYGTGTCFPPNMMMIEIFLALDIVGVIAGIGASAALINGRFRKIVPVGI